MSTLHFINPESKAVLNRTQGPGYVVCAGAASVGPRAHHAISPCCGVCWPNSGAAGGKVKLVDTSYSTISPAIGLRISTLHSDPPADTTRICCGKRSDDRSNGSIFRSADIFLCIIFPPGCHFIHKHYIFRPAVPTVLAQCDQYRLTSPSRVCQYREHII